MKISELVIKLNEYIEEPDAFETQSEREMEKELELEIDRLYKEQEAKDTHEFFKKRNGGINRVREYLSKNKYVRDLLMDRGKVPTLSFYIPERAFAKFCDWDNKEGNVLKTCGLKMYKENAEDGYRITIY